MKRWIVLLAYAAAAAVNAGDFWWGNPAGLPQMAASLTYIGVFGWWAFGNRRSGRWLKIAGGLTASAGVISLLTRAGADWLMLPSLLLAGITVTPLYGVLGLLSNFDRIYAMAALIGLLCLLSGIWRCKKPGKLNGDGKNRRQGNGQGIDRQ